MGGEEVELVGGLLDGLTIHQGPGRSPLAGLDIDRAGVRWAYRRTGARTGAGATVFRLDAQEAVPGAGPSAP